MCPSGSECIQIGQVCLNEIGTSKWPKLSERSSQGQSEGPDKPLNKRVLEDDLRKEVLWVLMGYQGMITGQKGNIG